MIDEQRDSSAEIEYYKGKSWMDILPSRIQTEDYKTQQRKYRMKLLRMWTEFKGKPQQETENYDDVMMERARLAFGSID